MCVTCTYVCVYTLFLCVSSYTCTCVHYLVTDSTYTVNVDYIIQGLAFQRGSHELFSCSFDRTVKVWNLDEMAYVETL